jgi:hypothetical protein
MQTYKVVLNSVAQVGAVLEVGAESQKEAETKALDFINSIDWEVVDVDSSETFIVSIENKDDPINFV